MTNQGRIWLLEIACVLTVFACVSTLLKPKLADLERRKAASGVLADVEIVRAAVYRFYSDSAYFPEESGDALIPANLAAYLPSGFSPSRPYGFIRYKNWPGGNPPANSTAIGTGTGDTATSGAVLPSISPEAALSRAAVAAEGEAASHVVGVVITANDPRILATAAARAPRAARFTIGNRYAFLFFGS